MTRMRWLALALVAGLVPAPGCGDGPGPTRVVELYFARLASDPIGTLPLLGDAFHAQHGLRPTTRQRARALRQSGDDAGMAGAPGPIDAPGELSRARLAWIAVQKREPVRSLAPALAVADLVETQEGDRALVSARVTPPGGPPFVQRFSLSRPAPGEGWRIDSVVQEEVAPASRRGAMAAAPSRARTLELLGTGRAR